MKLLAESESVFPMWNLTSLCSVDFRSLTLCFLVYVNLTQARVSGEEGASTEKMAL